MISLILVSVFSFNMVEVGLGIGTNTPIGNIERYFSAGASGSVYLAKELGKSKFILSYEKSNLAGVGQSTCQLQLDQVSFEYDHSVYNHENWSLPIYLGISNIWLKRKFQTLEEKGTVQAGDIGIGFLENISRTRFGVKFFVSGLYSLSDTKNSAYIMGLKITIGYVL